MLMSQSGPTGRALLSGRGRAADLGSRTRRWVSIEARGIVVRHGDAYHSPGRADLLLGRLDEARRRGEHAVEMVGFSGDPATIQDASGRCSVLDL